MRSEEPDLASTFEAHEVHCCVLVSKGIFKGLQKALAMLETTGPDACPETKPDQFAFSGSRC